MQVLLLTLCGLLVCYHVYCVTYREQCIIVGDRHMFSKSRANALWASVVQHYYTNGARELF
jgi:hypothetical protein